MGAPGTGTGSVRMNFFVNENSSKLEKFIFLRNSRYFRSNTRTKKFHDMNNVPSKFEVHSSKDFGVAAF